MKPKFLLCFALLALTSVVFISCKKDEPLIDPEAELNAEVVLWMYDAMEKVYFWNYMVPPYSTVKAELDPEAFFNSLIYRDEDRWSWLTDDNASLNADLNGTPTSIGFSPSFGRYRDSDKVFIIVTFVYPGSPASRAGLKRGDIILKINGQELNIDNYYSLYSQSSFTVDLGYYANGAIFPTSTTLSLSAEIIDSNPVVFDTVLEIAGHKIAYLVYVEFISGEKDALLNDFGMLIDHFNNQGVTELVVDLRYNPGGDIVAANYLASCFAPSSVVNQGKVFVKFIYNSLYQTFFTENKEEYGHYLERKFVGNGHNLNLSRAFFLTSDRSASASELLMIGLEPYMDVVQIGDTTYGKYTGAWVIADNNTPPRHNWAIVPIVNKYSNASGFGEFKAGLLPDYLIEDDLLEAKAFGDTSDPMLSQALELITGQIPTVKKSKEHKFDYLPLSSPSQNLRTNLFVPMPDSPVLK